MKKQLNGAIAKVKHVDEVTLFQAMAQQFNQHKNVKATYVKEVHRQMVEYDSLYYNGKKRIELGDLLFLTYSKKHKQLKICVMQVKYRKQPLKIYDGGNIRKLNCKGDLYQWELLRNKPDVTGIYKNSKWIPKNILNFRKDYMSITEYGVFYPVINSQGIKEIEFQCIPPEYFCPFNIPSNQQLLSNRQRGMHVPKGKTLYDISSDVKLAEVAKHFLLIPEDAIKSENMDCFEKHILSWCVGAPIEESTDRELKAAIWDVLRSMRDNAEDPTVIDDMLEDYIGNDEGSFEDYTEKKLPEGHPAAVVVVLEENRNEKREETGK